MRVALEIRAGAQAGVRALVGEGSSLRVGRGAKADLVVAGDGQMSGLHFAVTCDAKACRLRDLNSSNGTFLNGERVTEARLRDGDHVRAGDTSFVVRFDGGAVTAPAPAPPEIADDPTPAGRLARALGEQPEPLFALLDAARDPRVRKILRACTEEHASLYDGWQGEVLEDYAPYLVRLPRGSPLLATLAREGLGRSWGVYLTSRRPFAEVRRHLRRFLLVRDDDTDEELYFRFYDPRVLRVFLGCCTPRQAGLFFEDLAALLVEAEGEPPAALLRYTLSTGGVERRSLPLTTPAHDTEAGARRT